MTTKLNIAKLDKEEQELARKIIDRLRLVMHGDCDMYNEVVEIAELMYDFDGIVDAERREELAGENNLLKELLPLLK